MKTTNIHIFTLLLPVVFSGCMAVSTTSYEYDEIFQTDRYRFDTRFARNKKYEQEYWQNISILKEKNQEGKINYSMYDVITIPYESFDISDKMYIIIDNEVIELNNITQQNSSSSKINKKTESIMKADSSKVDIVTGYDAVNLKTYRMTHILTEDMVDKILSAKNIFFRYYSGANLITSEMKSHSLNLLKKTLKKNDSGKTR